VASYIGEEKCSGALERQLKRGSATADSFGANDLKALRNYITAAATLYVADAAKKEELAAKIQSLA
jgi:hypothetical protein